MLSRKITYFKDAVLYELSHNLSLELEVSGNVERDLSVSAKTMD